MSPSDPQNAHHTYLGTPLTPAEYYHRHSDRYANPHAEGVAILLGQLLQHLHGTVLDLGCGDGLVTKLAMTAPGLGFVGADSAAKMVTRYQEETGWPAVKVGFTDRLPAADSVVASYALHLATPSEAALLWWRLWETGANVIVVIGPFKSRPADPVHYFSRTVAVQGPYGPSGKTLYGRVYERLS